jgi:hypothetical protein
VSEQRSANLKLTAAGRQQDKKMVFAVQCPNPKCRKYMLVEDHDLGKIVSCLLCKTAIKVGGQKGKEGAGKKDEKKG